MMPLLSWTERTAHRNTRDRTCVTCAVLCCLVGLALAIGPVGGLAAADGPAAYNFASAQGEKHVQVAPDGVCRSTLVFYNVDGNRTTHVSLEVVAAPADWQVEILPEVHETEVEVNGVRTSVTENLYVEPGELMSEAPDSVPEGMVLLHVPGRGYTFAKEAVVVVTVPQSVEIGAVETIKVAAEAQWLGQSGAAAIKQERDFEFTVEVVAETSEFTETVVEEEGLSPSVQRWLPAVVTAALVLLGALLIPRLVVRRRKRSVE